MPLNIDWQQILLHMFNFVILFAALYFILYKPVRDFMDKRKALYEKMDKDTKEALESANATKAEVEARLNDIEKEAAAIKEASLNKTKEEAKTIIDNAKEEADIILKNAEKKAANEKESMLKSAKKEIVSLVSEATEKIVLSDNSEDAFDSFLNAMKKDE